MAPLATLARPASVGRQFVPGIPGFSRSRTICWDMPITSREARKLSTTREWPLIEASLPAALRQLTPARLRAKVARARTLRDSASIREAAVSRGPQAAGRDAERHGERADDAQGRAVQRGAGTIRGGACRRVGHGHSTWPGAGRRREARTEPRSARQPGHRPRRPPRRRQRRSRPRGRRWCRSRRSQNAAAWSASRPTCRAAGDDARRETAGRGADAAASPAPGHSPAHRPGATLLIECGGAAQPSRQDEPTSAGQELGTTAGRGPAARRRGE